VDGNTETRRELSVEVGKLLARNRELHGSKLPDAGISFLAREGRAEKFLQ
jgi:hypothetical protein